MKPSSNVTASVRGYGGASTASVKVAPRHPWSTRLVICASNASGVTDSVAFQVGLTAW
jgi:hypothetical protein